MNVVVSWTPVTTNQDGTLITDLSGYKVRMAIRGVSFGDPTVVSAAQTSLGINGLSAQSEYAFAVSAFDTTGNESGLSIVYKAPLAQLLMARMG